MPLFAREKSSPRNLTSLTAITAATLQVAGPTLDDRAAASAKRAEDWQTRAWDFYDEIGEVRFAARYMGDAQARLDLFVGVRPQPQSDPVPLQDGGDAELGYSEADKQLADEALHRLSSPLGGRREIQRALGVQLFVPGECYLVGEPEPPAYPDLEERWDVYSIDEVKIDNDTGRVTLQNGPGGGLQSGRELPADTVAYRIWRPHPRYSQWADSPLRSAMGILEELLILTRAINAAATSRLKGPGVLFLPNSLRSGTTAVSEAGGQATTEDSLIRDFITAAGTAIRDPGSAFAQVPLVVWMNDEQWASMGQDKLVKWDQGIDQIMADLRAELIQRFATAIDLPPEILTGKGGLNHWSAWLISDEAFRNHIEPMAMLIVDALTVNYLRPALQAAGMSVEDAAKFEIWYDPAALVADPDSGARALDAFERQLISDVAARRELGYSEDDAPEETEVTPEAPEPEPDEEPPDDRKEEPAPDKGPPDQEQPEPEDPKASVEPVTAGIVQDVHDARAARLTNQFQIADMTLVRDLQVRSDAVMRRALEKANARLRSLASRDPIAKGRLDGVPSGELLEGEALGIDTVRRLINAATDEEAVDMLMGPSLNAIGPWYDDRLEGEADALLDELGLSASERAQAEKEFTADREAGRLVLLSGMLSLGGLLLSRAAVPEPIGESDGSLLPTGVVRDALRVAGGGGPGAASFYTGANVGGAMAKSGFESNAWQWVYGPMALRQRPFQPHLGLDGMVFTDPDDERLGNPSLGWPGVTGYWPGDHKGCMCQVVRVWVASPDTCTTRPRTAAMTAAMCPDDVHDALTNATPKLDDKQELALKNYQLGSREFNQFLREGKPLKGQSALINDGLHATLVRTPDEFTTWRFSGADVFGDEWPDVGDIITDKGWSSTSIDGDKLDKLLSSLYEGTIWPDKSDIVLFEIQVPTGTRVSYLGDNPFFHKETGELLLPPNTHLEILGIDEAPRTLRVKTPGPGKEPIDVTVVRARVVHDA